jgi:hypothetical protein
MEFLGSTLTIQAALYCSAALFAAYFIRGIAGFGSALVAMPLLAMQMEITLIVPVICLLDYLASLTHGLQNRSRVCWADLLPLLPFTLCGMFAGFFILKSVDASSLAAGLAVFIICYAIYALLPLPPLKKGSKLWAGPAGFFGAMIGVIFGTGGPFYVMYFSLRQLDKSEFRATLATVFMIDGGLRLISFLAGGFYSSTSFIAVCAALPLLAAGLFFGEKVHLTISRSNFIRLVSFILLFSGMVLLVKVLKS